MEYLFISDIEGCEKIGRFNKQPQNTTMCDPAFYLTLHEKLVANKNLHVCFLGDYFDQGQGVINSIIGISFLKSSEEFGDRVHIILGNRDINKFRIYFEKDIDFSNNEIKRKMKAIGYSDNVDGAIKKNPENMMKWMNATMGVVGYDEKICKNNQNVNCRHGLNIDPRIDKKEAHKLLLDAFDPSNFVNGNDKKITFEEFNYTTTHKEYFITAFKKAICILYCKGNIVELIKDKKILLSHSGGHTPYIHKKLPDVTINEGDDYFTTYLEYKRNFPPTDSSKDITASDIKKANSNEMSDIEKSVKYHRGEIYSDFIKYFQSIVTNEDEALKKHIQLQCMGMPKVDIGFITPCDKKPAPNFKFVPKAVPYGDEVKYVAHGHTNFGLSFPIIYKYHDDGPTYIACDTSVGNRPNGESFKMNFLSFGENEEVTMGYKEYVVNGNQGVIKEGITYVPPVIDPLKIIEKVVNATPHQRGGKSRRKRKSKRRSNKTKRSKKRKTIKRRKKSRRNKKK